MPSRGRQRQRSRSPILVDSDRVVMHPYRKVRDEQGEYSGVEDSNPPVCAFLYALSLFDALIAHRDFDDYSTFGVATIRRRQEQGERNPGQYLHPQEETAIAPEVEEEERRRSIQWWVTLCVLHLHRNLNQNQIIRIHLLVRRQQLFGPKTIGVSAYSSKISIVCRGFCDIGQSIVPTKTNFCTTCPPNWQAGSQGSELRSSHIRGFNTQIDFWSV